MNILQNSSLQIKILPSHGGKAVSVFDKKRDFEFLFQNPKSSFRDASVGDSFSDYEACGFDDAFPGIDPETVVVDGKKVHYPDHGEIWASGMSSSVEKATAVQNSLSLFMKSSILPYSYYKTWNLQRRSVEISYRIRNCADFEIPAIWTCHCLVRIEPNMKIILPDGTDRIENVFDNDLLGKASKVLDYPVAKGPHGPVDLRNILKTGSVKYYISSAVNEGCCGFDYPDSGIRVRYLYDPHKLPYLGFWATAGGYRGDFNCALEPSTGYYDNIANAKKRGRCSVLKPNEEFSFSLTFEFSDL